jgi:hypothetical protein
MVPVKVAELYTTSLAGAVHLGILARRRFTAAEIATEASISDWTPATSKAEGKTMGKLSLCAAMLTGTAVLSAAAVLAGAAAAGGAAVACCCMRSQRTPASGSAQSGS